MIEDHVDVSKLEAGDGGAGRVQAGHRQLWGTVLPHHAVLQVEFVLVTGHGELWRSGRTVHVTLETQAEMRLKMTLTSPTKAA